VAESTEVESVIGGGELKRERNQGCGVPRQIAIPTNIVTKPTKRQLRVAIYKRQITGEKMLEMFKISVIAVDCST
jgi:hypothetical protein